MSVLGTGDARLTLAVFIGTRRRSLRYSPKVSLALAASPLRGGFACRAAEPLGPQSNKGEPLSGSVTTSHAHQSRNVDLASIGYALRPRLRSRLTPGGRPSPGKPQSNGGGDSHPSSLLTPAYSLPPGPPLLSVRLRPWRNAPLPLWTRIQNPRIRHHASAPVNLRCGGTRLVSCYALFEWWLLLSQHPSCLSAPTSFHT